MIEPQQIAVIDYTVEIDVVEVIRSLTDTDQIVRLDGRLNPGSVRRSTTLEASSRLHDKLSKARMGRS